MNSWAMLLLVDMAHGRYLRLGRPVNEYDWLCLLSMAQEAVRLDTGVGTVKA